MTSLERRLGVGAATALVVGEVIGVGIFLTPAGMAKSLGSPFWLAIVWIVMGGMALTGALCLGELAARLPRAGGIYVYLREAFGPGAAFLYGWMSLLVLDPGLTAALGVGLGQYVAYITGIGPVAVEAVAVGTILTLAGVNVLRVTAGARILGVLTVGKLAILLLIVVLGFTARSGAWSHFVPIVAQHPGSLPLAGALAAASVSGFFSFGGWWDVSKIAGEVRDPGRSLPIALAGGVIVVTFVYLALSAVFIYLVPLESVGSGETFAAQVGERLFGRSGGVVLAAAVVVCVLASLAAILMAAPRVYYAMASDGLFFRSVSRLHPRFGTPVVAIALQGTLAALLVLTGTFDQIVGYFIFVAIVFLGLAVVGLFVLRGRGGEPAPAYLTPGYPITPVVFLVLTAAMTVLIGGHDPVRAAAGSAVVAAGWPAYGWWRRRHAGEDAR